MVELCYCVCLCSRWVQKLFQDSPVFLPLCIYFHSSWLSVWMDILTLKYITIKLWCNIFFKKISSKSKMSSEEKVYLKVDIKKCILKLTERSLRGRIRGCYILTRLNSKMLQSNTFFNLGFFIWSCYKKNQTSKKPRTTGKAGKLSFTAVMAQPCRTPLPFTLWARKPEWWETGPWSSPLFLAFMCCTASF